ncbi:MAG: RNA methyltransferase [Rhodovibrionaceae bacterium]
MAGTDKSKPLALQEGGPVVILVRPQLGENIGMAARAMLNCGLSELRLVAPRDGWPNRHAVAAAVGADSVIAQARLYDSTEEAVADISTLYATTARPRGMVKPVVTPREAALEMRAALAAEAVERPRIGVLFGAERMGLTNEDVVRAERLIVAPLNPAYASLNLAQAVLLVAWEYLAAADETPAVVLPTGGSRPAGRALLDEFLARLDGLLDEKRFYQPPEKRPKMRRNLHNIFTRSELTEQELATLHGILSALLGAKVRD